MVPILFSYHIIYKKMTDARQRRMLCDDKYQICVPCVIFGQSPVFYIARVDDINRKTHAELRELKSLGLKDLHVGVETGSDIILKKCNKGISLDDMLSAFDALEKAEIEYSVTSILGLGGRALSDVNALDTAALYNRIHPNWIWCMALKLWENTPLFKLNAEGQFDMLTPKEMLLEERLMLENMQTDNCCFVDSTALNQYTLIGRLKKGKDTLIKALDQLIQTETN